MHALTAGPRASEAAVTPLDVSTICQHAAYLDDDGFRRLARWCSREADMRGLLGLVAADLDELERTPTDPAPAAEEDGA